jgi:DNA-directed RNA polymerase specialized sigma24 family protein
MKSREEIWNAVRGLTRAQLVRLKRFAQWRIRGLGPKALGRSAEDLLGEAICATASGQRIWNDEVDFSAHLLGAMRSISTNWHEKVGEEYLESELTQEGGEGPFSRSAVTNLDPERILQAKETLETVLGLFSKDDTALRIIQLLALGYSSAEIRAKLSITAQVFGAATKRIRRKLQAELPGLWVAGGEPGTKPRPNRERFARV